MPKPPKNIGKIVWDAIAAAGRAGWFAGERGAAC